jgi:hypothetical protein
VGLKLNGTRKLLAYADDVNLLGDSIDTLNWVQYEKRKLACRTLYKENTNRRREN